MDRVGRVFIVVAESEIDHLPCAARAGNGISIVQAVGNRRLGGTGENIKGTEKFSRADRDIMPGRAVCAARLVIVIFIGREGRTDKDRQKERHFLGRSELADAGA